MPVDEIWAPDERAKRIPELPIDRAHDHCPTVFAVIRRVLWRLRREKTVDMAQAVQCERCRHRVERHTGIPAACIDVATFSGSERGHEAGADAQRRLVAAV